MRKLFLLIIVHQTLDAVKEQFLSTPTAVSHPTAAQHFTESLLLRGVLTSSYINMTLPIWRLLERQMSCVDLAPTEFRAETLINASIVPPPWTVTIRQHILFGPRVILLPSPCLLRTEEKRPTSATGIGTGRQQSAKFKRVGK